MICDAIIIVPVDVTFELIHRRSAGDIELARWEHHFEPLPDQRYDAQAYELDVPADAIPFAPGDQFVFRYTGTNASAMQAFIPNGDGERTGGRIPNITLPDR